MARSDKSEKVTRGFLVLLGAVVMALGLTVPATAAHATPLVSVTPEPGSHFANPQTTISVRGIAPDDIGTVTVTGSTTGAHRGWWRANSDGAGATFHPIKPFAAGESVYVHTNLDVLDAAGGTYSFVVAQESNITAASPVDNDVQPSSAAPRNTSGTRSAAAPTQAWQDFHTRTDLKPPAMSLNVDSGSPVAGVIAATPNPSSLADPHLHNGVELLNNKGQTLYWRNAPQGVNDIDAKVQTLNGQNVLTFFEGQVLAGYGRGVEKVLDDTYTPLPDIHAGNGYQLDLHDMQIDHTGGTDHALIGIYNSVTADTTAFGGGPNAPVLEYVIQEVDPVTGDVTFEWHSLDHIPLSKSVAAAPTDTTKTWDYIHGNALAVDADGNILLSARHTSNTYKINRSTGALIWTLGRGGDFTPTNFNAADWFDYQHDFRPRGNNTYSVFDNGQGTSGLPLHRAASRGLVLSIDTGNMTATQVASVGSGQNNGANSQGDFEQLVGGHNLFGWGQIGDISEYDGSNHEILDMTYPYAVQSYRAEKSTTWHATPAEAPAFEVTRDSTFRVRARASWDGATDVASWNLLAGRDPQHLVNLMSSPQTSFETAMAATTGAPTIVIQAKDANGHQLAAQTFTFTPGDPPKPSGYWIARSDGYIKAFGTAPTHSSVPAATASTHRLVGMAGSALGGYWAAFADGMVQAIGAPDLGSLAGGSLRGPIVGIAPTPDENGFYLVGADGGVYPFGSARKYGSAAGLPLAAPIVAMAVAPDGRGYWLVARDGGVFAYGSARYQGSPHSLPHHAPIAGIAAAPTGGYWIVGSDGGVFGYGASFYGSAGGLHLVQPVVAMVAPRDGKGYWLMARDGGIFGYGSAHFRGSLAVSKIPVVGMAHD